MDKITLLAADTPADIQGVILTGFAGFGPVLLGVAAGAIGLAVIRWGLPQAVSFFKKTAK